jgi:CHC2 zinc finger
METSYLNPIADTRPNILEVIGRYTSLRKVGREFIGLSPCHNDRRPSLRVNADKQLWFCDPCHVGGDVIRFIELVEGVPFKEAINILGIGTKRNYRPVVTPAQRRAAILASAWMADQQRKINVLLGHVLEQIELADEIGDSELAESFIRERSFLADLYEDLNISRNATDLLSIRATIEAITEGIEL